MLLSVGSFSNPLVVLGASVNPLNCCCFLAGEARTVFGSGDQNDQSPHKLLESVGSLIHPEALKVLAFSRGKKLTLISAGGEPSMLPSLATRQEGQLAEIQIPCAKATSLLLSSPCSGVAHFLCSVHAHTRALCASRSASPSFSGAGSSSCRQEGWELWQWPQPHQRWLREAHGDRHRSL